MIVFQERCNNSSEKQQILDIEKALFFKDALTEKALISVLKNPDAYVILVKNDGVVVAYLFGYFSQISETADILKIAVIPEFQRQGFAEEMLEKYIYFLRKMKIIKLLLEVRETNVNAREFYEKRGFTMLGKRNDFYRFPVENALIFCYLLK